MQSTFVTFQKVCRHHKISQSQWSLNSKYNYIEFKNGSRIDLLDLKFLPSDELYERFGSLEYTGGWIEEAGEVHFGAFDVLKTRIGRHLNRELSIPPKLFVTCNPKKNWLYYTVYKLWKQGILPKEYAFIQSLYGDNPYTAEEYGRMLSQIKDKATKQRLKYGDWEYEDDDNALIGFNAIADLFHNTVNKSEKKYVTADIARFGKDKTIVYVWEGWDMVRRHEWKKKAIPVTANKIKEILRKEKVPYSHAAIDEDGVGGGVVDLLPGCRGFVNNSSPIQPEEYEEDKEKDKKVEYANLKAQCHFMMAERINHHQMAVHTDDETFKAELTEELEQVKQRDKDKESKLNVLKKEDIKDTLGRSPDYCDALMMRMVFELDEPSVEIRTHKQHSYVDLSSAI